MSAKSFAAIQKSFAPEAEQNFEFLVRDFGFMGPEYNDLVVQDVAFLRPGLNVRIALDRDEMLIFTRVETEANAVRLVADIDRLASAAGMPEGKKIRSNVHSLKDLHRVLEEHARLLALLLPYMTSDSIIDLMRKAKAREWRVH